jgi:glycosyltransferase involved in cell wall biosynthesis
LSLLPPRETLQHDIIRRAGLDELTCYAPQRFSAIVREFRPDLLHAHFATESAATARQLADEHRVPFTFTAHGYDIFRKPPPDFQARASAAAAVVTVSRANADYIASAFGVSRGHLNVIPCGVDTERFHPNGVDSGGPPLLLCVARHVLVKNLPVLLEACARLRDEGVIFRCVMIGDGPCRAELEAARERLGLQDLVQMPGAALQEEIAHWWQQAAVGLLTSDSEGMPVSLMEAAASGVPVVATAVGGVPELVQDGVSGILVPPRDPEALAGALRRLLERPELRHKMGLAARRHAVANLSATGQVNALLSLWSQILPGTA